ncbi:MAG: family 78 glycoside hydrolase catalytic domain [Clostridiales bacterium]|jgi:alpha-L-rhamnosidase|nr:family 78 glycoside hydrolase catalytic domain [Clostridiales bacterium]HOA33140.1 family 78 glycoside hydrolase catalytic domain [Clostridiales bacterium]HOJ34952.1 family 78 glycoside hydrolase catalytic domain [Clostridiales bacterium]HQA04724.1 family 78 glycoside hydrolase catalytic domain [Clostridiales bacterium]
MDKILSASFLKAPKYKEGAAFVFSKEFESDKPIKSATLQISSLGVYVAYLNGQRVGDFILAPGWTVYEKRLQYQTYDVTDLIKDGKNIITAEVGRGWRFHKRPQHATKHIKADEPALIASLCLTYNDGSEAIINTDSTWKSSESKTVYNDMYGGETYDDNFVSEEKSAVAFPHPKEILIPQEGEKVAEKERLKPQRLITTPECDTVIDFGQNLTGYVEFKAKGNKNDELVITHFEVLDKNGNVYTENLRKAKQQVRYICSGEEKLYKPSFTFYGFRFIKLEGFKDVNPDDFTAIAVYSDMKRIGHFESSDPLLNRLYENIIWGQRGNFLDVPTDCPQRDERLGWTGDAQVFIRVASMNYDVSTFFRKWLNDMAAEQGEDGRITHVIPATFDGGGSAAWGDAATICPWQLYLSYGNKEDLEHNFPMMKKWVDYIRKSAAHKSLIQCFKGSRNPYLWNTGKHFGDWLALDIEGDDEDARGATDHDYIATAFFAYSTELLIKAGEVLGKDMSEYKALHENIVKAYREEYVNPDGTIKINTQTACVLALKFGLTPDREATANQLVSLIRKYGHLTTGFVGTPYLLHVLTDIGEVELAYDLLLRKEYPSWLYPVTQGATTMWERWNGQRPDGSFATPGMNSFNHYAYGAVGDWLYSTAAGITMRDGTVAYEDLIFKPQTDKRLTFVKASIETARGTVASEWRRETDKTVYTFTVPAGSKAEAVLEGKTYKLNEGVNTITL